jgi:hypothetical protein
VAKSMRLDGVLAHQARHREAALVLLEPAITLARPLGQVPAQALHQARGGSSRGWRRAAARPGTALGGADQAVDDEAGDGVGRLGHGRVREEDRRGRFSHGRTLAVPCAQKRIARLPGSWRSCSRRCWPGRAVPPWRPAAARRAPAGCWPPRPAGRSRWWRRCN